MNHPRREGLPSVLPVPGGVTKFPEPVLPTRAYRARAWSRSHTLPLADRFWSYVDKGGDCWLWTGGLFGGTGYGSVYVGPGRRAIGAHRVSWEIHHGPIPQGLDVCHKCDVRACVNPAHLFVGTRSDNMRDCHRKGRSVQQTKPHLMVRGEQVNTAKLTEEKVRQIRSLYAGGRTNKSLATEYRVDRHMIQRIVARRSWRHVV